MVRLVEFDETYVSPPEEAWGRIDTINDRVSTWWDAAIERGWSQEAINKKVLSLVRNSYYRELFPDHSYQGDISILVDSVNDGHEE